jgi:hypothetical protein
MLSDGLATTVHTMSMFLVERYVASIDHTALDNLSNMLQRRAAGHWLGSLALPDDDLCLRIFRAANLSEVEDLNHGAGVGYERIVPMIAAPQSRFS